MKIIYIFIFSLQRFFGPRNTIIHRLTIEICAETHVDVYAVFVIILRFYRNCNVSINASKNSEDCLIPRIDSISSTCGRKKRDKKDRAAAMIIGAAFANAPKL